MSVALASTGSDKFARHMEAVARKVLGDPNRALSSQAELRFGTHGSVSVDLEGGVWADHEAKTGGGVLDFLRERLKLDGQDAIEWLNREVGAEIGDRPGYGDNRDAGNVRPIKRIVATYDYVDEVGELLFQTVRYDPKDFRQRRPGPTSRDGWSWSVKGVRQVLYRLPDVLRAVADGRTVFVCYSPDTEVLTPEGWVAFPDLGPNQRVAQWSLDGAISFVRPSAHQRFEYEGEMVHVVADWCDLLITPDHRQPVSYRTKGREWGPTVIRAGQIRQGHKLPVSGILETRSTSGPTADQARLIAAWLADGVWEPRGNQVSFNLKKTRKQERLRELLRALDIAWTEHVYPSTPGWRNFRIRKDAVSFIWKWAPDKRWPWSALSWPSLSRSAALSEVGVWDGDKASAKSSRFFTGDRQSADVVSALAAATGAHANLRVDRRRGRNDSFVVNLNTSSWRQLAYSPKAVAYAGAVYCCTVETGFLVVRRNGKVTISGNCEGEKDADNLAREGLCATTNAMGAGKWPDELSCHLAGADVVILRDNDDAGKNHAAVVGAALRPIAGRLRTLELRGLDAKQDVSDWLAAGGDGAELSRLVEAEALDWRTEPPKSRFGAIQWADRASVKVNYAPLVKGLIYQGDTGMFYGESGSGKSFLAVDLGLSIARGVPFLGMKTARGSVIYQAGEGGKGLLRRLDAYEREHRIGEPLPFVLLPERVDLFAQDGDAEDFIAECLAWRAHLPPPLALIVIDTFSAASPGANENASEDMGRMLDAGYRLNKATGAAILWVHHKNAAGLRERGHSSFRANIETVVEVKRDEETKERSARLVKLKDGEDGWIKGFELQSVELGTDDDGDPITSCVVRPAQVESSRTGKKQFLPRGQFNFLRVLDSAIAQWGGIVPVGGEAPHGTYGVEYPKFRDLYRQLLGAGKEQGAIRTAISRDGDALWRGGFIERHEEWFWITERGKWQLSGGVT